LAASLFAYCGVDVDEVTVDAAPAKIFAMSNRFFARRITLPFALTALLRCCPNDPPVDAAPTRFSTMPQRFFSG
jgi:hypothetical protein